MKINLNKPITDLEGNPVGKATMAKELASGLSQQTDNANALKIWEWCQKLHKDGQLDLDTTDYELFKNTLQNCRGFTVFFLGQVLQELATQKK